MPMFDKSAFSEWLAEAKPSYTQKRLNMRAVIAELIGMTLFVFIGTGTAVNFSTPRLSNFASDASAETPVDGNTTVTDVAGDIIEDVVNLTTIQSSFGIATAMAFGMAIMVLAYSLGHISGGQFNPAVTLALFLSGNLSLIQGLCNMVAQVIGAILASGFVFGMTPDGGSSSLGANIISDAFTSGQAFLGEAIMTCVLCFVVLMTVCDRANNTISPMQPIAIGFAVFLGHTVMIPVDGCSINPARSLGPAIVANEFDNFWVFVLGPFTGAIVAVLLWLLVSKRWDQDNIFDKHAGENSDTLTPEVNMVDAAVVKMI